MNQKKKSWLFWILLFSLLLFLVAILSLCIGSTNIPLRKIFLLLAKAEKSTEYSIIYNIRLPRILLGLAVGSALSIAGVILQGMFRNPLVEPYTLGISGGAALGVCLNLVFKLDQLTNMISLPISGFIGALAVILMLYSFSIRKRIVKIQGLLLTGVMISFISSSLMMLLMAMSRSDDLQGIIYWIMGSLDEPSWGLILTALIVSLVGLLLGYKLCFQLNALSLGEEEAQHLGIHIEKSKRLLFFIASILTGVCVSVAGIIGFVGLVVPHFVRMITGPDHRILLICSFLGGGAFLIFCDTIARTIIAPLELPVGVITGILGGTMFIVALRKARL